jgi:hypothetical protein
MCAGLTERTASFRTGQPVAAQFSLYPQGLGHHMDAIYGCIDFLKSSGTFERSKNFCTKLRGDAGPVFETLSQAFTGFGAQAGHVTLDVILWANSASKIGIFDTGERSSAEPGFKVCRLGAGRNTICQ